MIDAGIHSDWMVMEGAPEFFEITKRLHNLLQGAEGVLTGDELDRYVDHNARVARELKAQGVSSDVWVLHDPQSLPLASFLPPGAEIIWVCHIDTTLPNPQVIQQLLPLMQRAGRVVFSLPQYVVDGLDISRVHIVPPAIDPLLPKNIEPDARFVRRTLLKLGIDLDRPMMSQVARFDLWKDPWGVIDAYRLVKKEAPDVQLAMLGVIEAKDDPEAFDVLEAVHRYAGEDPDVHLFSDPMQVGQPEVGAVQTGADVIIQKSLREGFGLSVTEAMWKGKPVIGGNCGGIRIQIDDGRTGYLVDSVEECAQYMLELVKAPEKAQDIGRAARESVRQKFLMPRLLGDYLSVISDLLTARATKPAAGMRTNGSRPGLTPELAPGD
jgi:trehalose synthase